MFVTNQRRGSGDGHAPRELPCGVGGFGGGVGLCDVTGGSLVFPPSPEFPRVAPLRARGPFKNSPPAPARAAPRARGPSGSARSPLAKTGSGPAPLRAFPLAQCRSGHAPRMAAPPDRGSAPRAPIGRGRRQGAGPEGGGGALCGACRGGASPAAGAWPQAAPTNERRAACAEGARFVCRGAWFARRSGGDWAGAAGGGVSAGHAPSREQHRPRGLGRGHREPPGSRCGPGGGKSG